MTPGCHGVTLVMQEVLQKRKSFTQTKQTGSLLLPNSQNPNGKQQVALFTQQFSVKSFVASQHMDAPLEQTSYRNFSPTQCLPRRFLCNSVYIAFNTFREHTMKSVATVSRTLHEEQTWGSGKALGRNPAEQRPEDVLQHLEQLLIFGLETPTSSCQN